MEKTRAIELLKLTNALLEGHFKLTSGNHSSSYVQCALLLAQPKYAFEFMRDIADHFINEDIDTVVSPAVGGIIVSYEVAKLLGKRSMFFERENGIMTLRRGFNIEKGENILIVEDVITTGGSVREVEKVVREKGGVVKGFSSIVNRSNGRFDPDVQYYYSLKLDIPIYKQADCPLCKKGIPIRKPGSRDF